MKFILTSACALGIALAALGRASSATADTAMPSCASGDPVVWENTSTKVYHARGDSYYGKTKNGKYACQSDADKAGFHLSKSKSKGGTSPAASGSAASAAPDAMASPTGKKHHHKGGSTASPAPDAASTPDAMTSPSARHHRHKHGALASPSPAPAAT